MLLNEPTAKKKAVQKIKSIEGLIRDTACSIRGKKETPRYKDYILPLIVAKRLCDVIDDEFNRFAAQVGVRQEAFQWVKADHKLVSVYLPRLQ